MTTREIKKIIQTLREKQHSIANNSFLLPTHPMSLIDMLLTYKRPKASNLYKMLKTRRWP